tara:strand:+ start:5125 stop:5592 length:468 start_codon:yes stop_codon:yes gene_type:complete
MPDATDFIRANQIGLQEDLEFTNAESGPTLYIMRGQGFPTSSLDTKALVTFGYVQGNLLTKQQYFSGSQSASLDSDGHQVFQVNLEGTGSQTINGNTLEVFLNGLSLRNDEIPNVHSSDYFKSDNNKVTIYKVTGSYGYNLKDEDRIKIKFNQGL